MEYDEHHVSLAAYVKFRLTKMPKALENYRASSEIYALIWTTTPWTLPANQAIAVHNELPYTVFKLKASSELVIVAKSRLSEVLKQADIEERDVEVVMDNLLGADLLEAEYVNVLHGPTAEAQSFLHADFVSASSGSGLVHMAPAHGMDDFEVCSKLGGALKSPIDDLGSFTEVAYPGDPAKLQGKNVLQGGSQSVLELLTDLTTVGSSPLVWATHQYKHKYPIDWRTKKPVIVRATAQWFADVRSIKNNAMEAMQEVQFVPETGRTRLESFIMGRSHWCISRQRAWGVPIPALYRTDLETPEAVMTPKSIDHIISVINARGIDAWWADSPEESAWVAPHLPKGTYVRGKDTMDVWFDSGTTWTQLPRNPSGGPPASVYLEGTDQHRGWFQSSLLTFVASNGNAEPAAAGEDAISTKSGAPFATLITHGFTLDQDGRKMSKSLGNVISPDQIIDGTLLPPLKPRKKQQATATPVYDAMGPDALRLWVASSDYLRDVVIGQPVLQAVNGTLHKLRVTFKWLLGVLSDFDAEALATHEALIQDDSTARLVDRIALHQLALLSQTVNAAYISYEPFKAVNALTKHINLNLSSFYFETIKDTLYAGTATERLHAQATCYEIFHHLLAMLAPITPLLVAEVLHHASGPLAAIVQAREHDPFRRVWTPPAGFLDAALVPQIEWLGAAHDAVKAAQEAARANGHVKSGLQSEAVLTLPKGVANSVATFFVDAAIKGDLEAAFVVSRAEVVVSSTTPGSKLASSVEELEDHWRVVREFEVPMEDGSLGRGSAMVLPPGRAKCDRCWRYVVEKAEEEKGVCGRCTDVLRHQGHNI